MAVKCGDLPTMMVLLESGKCDLSIQDDVRMYVHTYVMYNTIPIKLCTCVRTYVAQVVTHCRYIVT